MCTILLVIMMVNVTAGTDIAVTAISAPADVSV